MFTNSSKEYYDANPKSKANKESLIGKSIMQVRPENVKKRAELVKINRKAGTYGNGDGKDASHTKNGIVMKKATVNRASKTDSNPGDVRSRGGKKIRVRPENVKKRAELVKINRKA